MVMGLVSGLSLANHSDSESFLVVHALFSQDECQREGFWEVVRHVVSHFDLSRTLPVGGGLLVPCSLPGPPVVNDSCTWSLWCLARMGGFRQCASPSSITVLGENRQRCVCMCVTWTGAESSPSLLGRGDPSEDRKVT